MDSNYIVLTSTSLDELCHLVNLRMKDGFFPQGGVTVVARAHIHYYQAMVKVQPTIAV